MLSFEILEHTADLAIKAYGKSLSELFINMVKGIYQVMFEQANFIGGKKQIEIKIKGEGEQESLLVDFLNEILYQIDSKEKILSKIKFKKISPQGLVFSAKVSPLLRRKIEIKAATYHDLKIKQSPAGFETTVVFDI